MISSIVKLEVGLLSVNAIVAVCPAFKFTELVPTIIDGTIVSTVIIIALFASDPSVLLFPKPSVNLLLDTLITPLVILFSAGVNVAV